MAFKKQIALQKQNQAVQEIFQRNNADTSRINELLPLVDNFEIRVPFIGGFSSGKSSLINALLKEPLLSTEITPETAVAAELRYGASKQFNGILQNGKTISYQEDEVSDNRLAQLVEDGGILSIQLNSNILAENPHLILVDMPGWGSGVKAHVQVIDNYASRSLAYVVVVSVDEGTLQESLRKALLELAIQDKPVILVISKADKRDESDVQAVANNVAKEITQLMGHPPITKVVTSSRKRNTQALEQALKDLEKRAEQVFDSSVVVPWRNELQRVMQLLQMLATQEFKNAELINAEIQSFEQQTQEFQTKLARETNNLEQQVEPMLNTIRLAVDRALAGRLEALTDRALSGSDINDEIMGTVRLVTTQALKNEFESVLGKYVDRVADALPSRLDFNLDMASAETEGESSSGIGKGFLAGGVAATGWGAAATLGLTSGAGLASLTGLSILAAPALPVLAIAAGIAAIVGGLFSGNKQSAEQQEAAEARRREGLKSKVREALSQVSNQVENSLRPVMESQIHAAKSAITEKIEAESNDIHKILVAKREALQMGEQQAAEQRQKAQADLQVLERCIKELA